MMTASTDISTIATALLPSLSKSLAEQFNIFRVMHHGTHEKQLSNIFAWLLSADGTHHLGDRVQQAFLKRVNDRVAQDMQLPLTGYSVVQEVDTRDAESTAANESMDIADILLWRSDAALVIENYGTSDGHGHDYQRYLAFGSAGGRRTVVVLLCHRHEAHLQKDGWESATVVTYSDVLFDLKAAMEDDPGWSRKHPDQLFFINQMYEHFVKGPDSVSIEDQVEFIKTMCETGESARYGYRPRDRAVQEFADLVAEHARRQFEDSRVILARAKDRLRNFGQSVLMEQANSYLHRGRIDEVVTRFQGQWEWCVELQRTDSQPTVFLEFGPTAVAKNALAKEPIIVPDYSRIFVTLQSSAANSTAEIVQTEVSLAEVAGGLAQEDTRLCDAVLTIVRADSQ
jgi:hypothetical protein